MHPLPHLEHPPIPRPDDLPVSVAKHIAIILQRSQWHESFNKQIIQLNEETILRTRENDGIEVLANTVLHELDLLPLDQLPLGIIGPRSDWLDSAAIAFSSASGIGPSKTGRSTL